MSVGRRLAGRLGIALAERLELVAERRADDRSAQPIHLAVVYVRGGGATDDAAFPPLEARLSGLPGVIVRRVIVDNGIRVGDASDGGRIVGDNSAREFTGWARGIEHLRSCSWAIDVWLLTNDRFQTWSYPFLSLLTEGTLRATMALDAVVGRLDYYPDPVESFGLHVSSWVNTSFFLVTDAVLQRVGGPVTVGPDDLDRIMPEAFPGTERPFIENGPVGSEHAHHLLAFLTHAPDAPHGAHWYRRLALTEDDWPELRGKVMSILNEQLLSARCRSRGVPMVEMGLAGRLGAMDVRNPAVRRALARLAQMPDTEPLRLNRIASRIRLAAGAIVALTTGVPERAML